MHYLKEHVIDFTETLYEDQAFKSLAFEKRDYQSIEFHGCTFARCDFHETIFQDCVFRDCRFRDCDLSLIRVKGSTFSGVKFEDSKVVGVNWSEAKWTKMGLLNPSVDFTNCTINYSTFIGVSLKKANITRCTARDVDFSEANLTAANCTYTDFSESRFAKTDLTGADFTHATHYLINVQNNVVKKAKFSLPEAMALLLGLGIELVE